MGQASVVQMSELSRLSYAPLAEVFRSIAPRESRHAELAVAGVRAILTGESGGGTLADVRESLEYWQPRVAMTFGKSGSDRFDRLARLGLRHRTNDELAQDWRDRMTAVLAGLNLT